MVSNPSRFLVLLASSTLMIFSYVIQCSPLDQNLTSIEDILQPHTLCYKFWAEEQTKKNENEGSKGIEVTAKLVREKQRNEI